MQGECVDKMASCRFCTEIKITCFYCKSHELEEVRQNVSFTALFLIYFSIISESFFAAAYIFFIPSKAVSGV